jgi:hypothetical protein
MACNGITVLETFAHFSLNIPEIVKHVIVFGMTGAFSLLCRCCLKHFSPP